MDCCQRKIIEVLAAREVVLSKLLAARKTNFSVSARARKKIAELACSRMLAKKSPLFLQSWLPACCTISV